MNSLGFPDYNINGLIPVNIGTPDAEGTYWYLDGDVKGWDSPPGRVTMLPKIGTGPASQGEYPADLHYKGRTITMKIRGASPSEAAREASKYLLAQALDLVDTAGTFYVNEEIPKSISIRRSGENAGKLTMLDTGFASIGSSITRGLALPQPAGNDGLLYLIEADVEFYSADPFKYAQTPQVVPITGGPPSIATVTNEGNTATQAFFADINSGISGSSGPLFIATSLQEMILQVPNISGASPFPSELIVNFGSGTAAKTISDPFGNNYYYLRNLQTPWLSIPPGTWEIAFGLANPVGGTVTLYSTWI